MAHDGTILEIVYSRVNCEGRSETLSLYAKSFYLPVIDCDLNPWFGSKKTKVQMKVTQSGSFYRVIEEKPNSNQGGLKFRNIEGWIHSNPLNQFREKNFFSSEYKVTRT